MKSELKQGFTAEDILRVYSPISRYGKRINRLVLENVTPFRTIKHYRVKCKNKRVCMHIYLDYCFLK